MKRFELKKMVYNCNLELVQRGLVIYTWGNVSAIDRENGIVAIKPRGIEYDQLTIDDMAVVDLEGNPVEGKLLPSVDLDIHLEIYRNFLEVGGIAHTHSVWATAWAQACREIPVLGTTHADHFYGSIPCTRQLTQQEVEIDYERNVGRVIVETFQDKNPMQIGAVLTPGHGPFTWGKTAGEAVEHSVILEEIAKMAKLTEDIGGRRVLPDYLLTKHYTRKYGAKAYFYQKK
jgi:L-ribulose-5-phosphate 4-epimerase